MREEYLLYLKKIEIKGFKSFPDKTEIFFPKGLISIVGPNGSGKSNILDATRWVLGEQSMKTLRGEKLEDVIFSGTEKRKEMSHCEVSLLIDNADQKLNMDYSEVEIKRKAFKSGESQFFINNKLCRLKDIKELLLDTGIGREGYSIISQGKVNELVDGNPVHRRKVIEEAAGITKYRYRKEESQKKLDATKENLDRICDIYHEIERQVKPLKDQKEKAEKYLSVRERLIRSDVNRLLKESENVQEKIQSLQNDIDIIESQKSENQSRQKMFQQEANQLKVKIEHFSKKIQEIETKIETEESLIHSMSKEQAIFQERKENIEISVEKTCRTIEKIQEEKILLEQEHSIKKNLLDRLLKEMKDLEKDYIQKKATYEICKKQWDDSEKQLENNRVKIVEWMNEQSSIKTKSEFLSSEIERNREEYQSLTIEVKEFETVIQEIHAQERNSDETIEQLKKESDSYEKKLIQLKQASEDCDQKIRKEEQFLRNSEGALNGLLSKNDLLKKMDEEMEGISKGAKDLVQRSPVDGIINIVANVIKVRFGYERAIEVALGGSLQHVIVDKTSTAKDCIRYLKEKRSGRVTFLPIETISASAMKYQDIGMIASECVDYPPNLEHIIHYLLGKVVIVSTMDEAISISKKYHYRFKIVTVDGEVFHAGGSVTGGSTLHAIGVFTRRKSIEEYNEQIQKNRQDIEDIKNQIQNENQKKNKYQSEIIKISQEHLKISEKIQDEIQKKNQLFVELQYKKESFEKLKQRIQTLLIRQEEDTDILNKHLDEISVYENRLTELKLETSRIIQEREKERSDMESKESILRTCQVSQAQIQERIVSVENEEKNLQKQLSKLEKNKSLLSEEDQRERSLMTDLDLKIEKLHSQINSSKEIQSTLKTKISNIHHEKSPCIQQIEQIQTSLDYLEKSIIQQDSKKMKLELDKVRHEDHQQLILSRLEEEYQMDFDSALQMIDSEVNTSKKYIESLKNEIFSMGNVNLNAIEEFRQVNERYELYRSQKIDLEKSISVIEDLIVDLEKNMVIEFDKSFREVNEKFKQVFEILFGGGRAELVLSDQENLLTSTIEINVQPPGKKLKSVSVLSGGEKALAAIAILFAILIRKPVPFCILDEIDAPLDDANIYRFVKLLRELSVDTQFLMITHRRGTMEFSDYIYGITMQENGISKIVSLQLEEAQNYIES